MNWKFTAALSLLVGLGPGTASAIEVVTTNSGPGFGVSGYSATASAELDPIVVRQDTNSYPSGGATASVATSPFFSASATAQGFNFTNSAVTNGGVASTTSSSEAAYRQSNPTAVYPISLGYTLSGVVLLQSDIVALASIRAAVNVVTDKGSYGTSWAVTLESSGGSAAYVASVSDATYFSLSPDPSNPNRLHFAASFVDTFAAQDYFTVNSSLITTNQAVSGYSFDNLQMTLTSVVAPSDYTGPLPSVTAAVPELKSWAMALVGFLIVGIAGARRRRIDFLPAFG